MRATIGTLGSMFVLSTVLAACGVGIPGSSATRYASGSATQTAVVPPALATDTALIPSAPVGPTGSAGPGYGGYGGDTGYGPNPTPMPTAEAVIISLAVADSPLGKILVDGSGMTLYVLTRDGPNQSTCKDACALIWPPLPLAAEGKSGPGIDSPLLGSTTRTDGALQMSYSGRPLYHFASDSKAGDVNGQGFGGVWFVVSPAGEPIKG